MHIELLLISHICDIQYILRRNANIFIDKNFHITVFLAVKVGGTDVT